MQVHQDANIAERRDERWHERRRGDEVRQGDEDARKLRFGAGEVGEASTERDVLVQRVDE